jgi:hypothetical protein
MGPTMLKNALRAFVFVAFASLVAYSAFVPAHAGTGYGVDEIESHAG